MCNGRSHGSKTRTRTQESKVLISEIRRFWTAIAENEATPESLLNQLAEHPDYEVRMALVDNPCLTTSVVAMLVVDSNPDVRYRLAENAKIALSFLNQLADDENPYVAWRAQKTLSRMGSRRTNAFHLLAASGRASSF